jgi:hypothetical protein
MQIIKLGFDNGAVWNRVKGRLSVFMDTNFWIEMADEASEAACRLRDKLKELVVHGCVFCPLSWGIIQELRKQSGESLRITAGLMEELSLNAIFVNRTEVYQWELSRSVRRLLGEPVGDSLDGLFTPPGGFVGSRFDLGLSDYSLSDDAQAHLREYMKRELGKIGVVELVNRMGESTLDETPPAYSQAAKRARESFKGDKEKLFLNEAGDIFQLYITPVLLTYPQPVVMSWLAQFGTPNYEEAWFRKALSELPALHNFIDVMTVADSQPHRKDTFNHFMDNEIVVAPLAYANVFASLDRAIRDMLRNRTKILSRTTCQYCDSFDALETWLTENADR